jgi:hypothetical protein
LTVAEPLPSRIGHAERDRTVERLREAAGLGRITLEELDERVGAALTARTQPDLDTLLADLGPTGPSAVGGGIAVRGPAAVVPAASGYAAADPMVISAGSGTTRKSGRWALPGFVKLSASLGSIKLDCRQATTEFPVVDVEIVPSAGSVVIVVPPGWAANIDRLGRGIGSAKSKVPEQPTEGYPLLLVRGGVGLGSVTVRHQRWYDRRPRD